MTSPFAAEILADREVLYFVKQNGCEACEAALPELEKFRVKHPAMQVLVLDAYGPHPATLGIKVKETPTYAYRRGAEIAITAGALKTAEIEKWIKKLTGGHR